MNDANEGNTSSDRQPQPRDAGDAALIESSITELFEQRITFNAFLGFTLEAHEHDRVRIGFDMRPELVGHFLHGRLHGGVISSVLDAAGGLAVMWSIVDVHPQEPAMTVLQRFATLGTIDLRVDFLRQGIGARFVASAETVRLGRRIAATSMRLENDEGTLIATGNATYIVS